MELVKDISRCAQLGEVVLKDFDGNFNGEMYIQQDENGLFWVKETSQGLGDGGWEWGVKWELGGSDGEVGFDSARAAFDDMVKTLYATVRTAREGDGDCVTDFALPYDCDETGHQRDELKRLKRMEGGRRMAAEWKADNEGNPDERDTTWRKHDGGYQATVKWDDGGEKRYRWDVLDTDDRTVDSGHSDSIEDAKNDADGALEEYLKAHEKESAAFRVAQDIDELTDAADDLMDGDPDGVPAGEIAKAEWVASRMAERHMTRKIDDDVRHHLAGMGCTVGLIACAKLTEKKAYAEYKAEAVKSAKHVGNRKPRLKTKEARYKAWAARKIAFGGDVAIFIGAVSNPTNGDWLSLPASDSEIDEAIERAQTGPDGEFYEEVMIADTDGLGNSVGEYDDIRKVNEWVEAVEDAGLDEDLKTKEARYKAWAARKIAFGGDVAIFIGAVSNPTNGDWLSLPASDSEIDEAIERAQTGPDGEFYEEVMIADTDGLGNSVGEYDDIRKVNEWVEAVEDAGLDEDLLEALLDEYDLEYVADNIDSVDYWNDVDDEKDLGYRIIEELGWDGISDDDKQMYFDYEGFGRDIVINDGYTIDNGFAFRVASRTALGNDIHARMLVALAEKNVREKVGEKVKTKVKTCGKMAAARKTKRKAASMTKKAASLFEEIERSGVPDSDISHWNSDLYLRVTPETTAIIDGYEFKSQVSTFIDEIDGKPWYEVPFAYDPAWNR